MTNQPRSVDPWIAFQQVAAAGTAPTSLAGYSQTNLADFTLDIYNGIYGYVAKVGTIKTPTGYGVSWSTQLNLKTPIINGGALVTVFAPKWNSVNTTYYVGYVCAGVPVN